MVNIQTFLALLSLSESPSDYHYTSYYILPIWIYRLLFARYPAIMSLCCLVLLLFISAVIIFDGEVKCHSSWIRTHVKDNAPGYVHGTTLKRRSCESFQTRNDADDDVQCVRFLHFNRKTCVLSTS